MTVTVTLELRFKPDEVAAGRELMGRVLAGHPGVRRECANRRARRRGRRGALADLRTLGDGRADEAYRAFRAGEGKITQLPPLLAAPPVKTRYLTSDV